MTRDQALDNLQTAISHLIAAVGLLSKNTDQSSQDEFVVLTGGVHEVVLYANGTVTFNPAPIGGKDTRLSDLITSRIYSPPAKPKQRCPQCQGTGRI